MRWFGCSWCLWRSRFSRIGRLVLVLLVFPLRRTGINGWAGNPFLLILRSTCTLTGTGRRRSSGSGAWSGRLPLALLVIRFSSLRGHSSFFDRPPTLELELGHLGLFVLALLFLNLDQALGRHLQLGSLSLSISLILLNVEEGHCGGRARRGGERWRWWREICNRCHPSRLAENAVTFSLHAVYCSPRTVLTKTFSKPLAAWLARSRHSLVVQIETDSSRHLVG